MNAEFEQWVRVVDGKMWKDRPCVIYHTQWSREKPFFIITDWVSNTVFKGFCMAWAEKISRDYTTESFLKEYKYQNPEMLIYLQANPHLLREDGEKKERKIQDPTLYAHSEAKKIMEQFKNTRPTDMETEARDTYEKIRDTMFVAGNVAFLDEVDCIPALTEFGEMCKQRGREEEAKVRWTLMDEKMHSEIKQLKHQLAEREDKILTVSAERNGWYTMYQNKKAELTAAKAEIERWVEKYNYDYERVVPLIREMGESGEKLVSIKDTVICIGKLMDEIEKLKNENGNLELALKNM